MKDENQTQKAKREFELWTIQRINKGIRIGEKRERTRNLNSLATYLINESNQKGNTLSDEEAMKQAKKILLDN